MSKLTRYPWPVINDGDSVEAESYVTDIAVDANVDRFKLQINHKLNSAIVSKYIKEGFARYATEISCVATNYREVFFSENPEQQITIPSKLLRGMVQVRYYILLINDIRAYSSPNFHADYRGAKFDLNKGSVLAVAKEDSKFDAKKRYAGTVSMSSYLTFEARPELVGEMYVNTAEDKIVVNLPLPDHNVITGLLRANAPDINAIIEGAYAYPALLVALNEAFGESLNNESKFWFQCIKKVAQDQNIEWDRVNMLSIAQAALKLPATRAANAVKNIVAPVDADDE